MESFLAPPDLPVEQRVNALRHIYHTDIPGAPVGFDIEIQDETLPPRRGVFDFQFGAPALTVKRILRDREELGLPLARLFPPFREEVCRQIVRRISRENALFSMATALPNVVPSVFELPWAVGEFASDTAILTANQIRMAFLLAAASDREVGYTAQKTEMGSIIAGAFGWRALARELVGKIPLGGGLIPKAAVAYAGTFVVGQVHCPAPSLRARPVAKRAEIRVQERLCPRQAHCRCALRGSAKRKKTALRPRRSE